jgi:L-lactate dehydrogenase
MKIGVVGCGQVGSASAYACVMSGVGTEMVLVDKFGDLARAQAEDILHATPFSTSMSVTSGDYSDLAGAGIVMIAAGVGQKQGETRLDLLKRNADLFHDMIPAILKAAPDAVLLIATNPVDILTHMVADIAIQNGHTKNRVIGSGTILDTARFRALLAQHLGVSSHSVHAYVLGEHGDSEVLHWSGVSVGNMGLRDFAAQRSTPVTQFVEDDIDDKVRRAAYRIIQGKGATWYGIGAGMARIARAIIGNEHAILTCSTWIDDVEGIKDVTLSLPQIVGRHGIEKTIYPLLNTHEAQSLKQSASIIKEALESLQV